MQTLSSKEQLLEKLDRLNPLLQQTVVAFIDGLLKTQSTRAKRDKSRLLSVSVWCDDSYKDSSRYTVTDTYHR